MVVAGWAIDTRGREGQALRNVEVVGRDVSGLDRRAMTTVLDGVAAEAESAGIVVQTPDGDLEADGPEVGLTVDRQATAEAALEVGRDEPLVTRPFRWLWSFVDAREAPLVVAVDRSMVAAVLAARDPSERREPVEPGIMGESGEIAVRRGQPGRGLDADHVAAAIVEAARTGEVPIVAEVEPVELQPRFDREDAERLAERARELTATPLRVQAGDEEALVSTETLRSWITSTATPEGLQLDLDGERVNADLADLLAGAGRQPVDATVRIEGGRPVIQPGREGSRCCDEIAPSVVLDAIVERQPDPLRIPLAPVPPERTTEDVRELGVVERIGEFTTNFPAGQSRVQNIHRMADLVRGVLIEPGDRFSINEHVGRRTAEKGFVSGGVIENGVFAESVGGGVSQFATTLFNAAFFGGLNIPEYQSHSIYISRYPYGREATLSFPKPDLVIANNTPHGVLIHTSYTSTSITVSLWSTRYATGEQTGQTEAPAGNCTRVRTERTRTFVDGHTEVDHVYALYRPEEGVQC